MIAQTLATLSLMEQRGTGFARMRDAMLNHGLEEPAIAQQDGFFVVTLPGPAGNFDRIRVPENAGGLVTPAVEAALTERQKKMVAILSAGEELTSRRCETEFGISRPIAARDFGELMQLGLAERIGSGRSTRYRAPIVR
jgi:predicted HTH transcriptional regulator